MIQIAENQEEQQSLLLACRKSAFGCKIASIATAYGFDKKFSCFWMEGHASAAYCLVDDVMILAGMPKNAEETKSFLHMVGAREIMCALRNAELLELPAKLEGDILQKQAEGGKEAGLQLPERESTEINIREVYFLLEACEMETDFEAFYLMRQAEHALTGKTLYVFKEKGRHEEFYQALGYHRTDAWVVAELS